MTITARLHARIKSLESRVIPEVDDPANLDDHALLTRVRAMFVGKPHAPWESILGESGKPLGHMIQGLIAEARDVARPMEYAGRERRP